MDAYFIELQTPKEFDIMEMNGYRLVNILYTLNVEPHVVLRYYFRKKIILLCLHTMNIFWENIILIFNIKVVLTFEQFYNLKNGLIRPTHSPQLYF